MVMNSDNGEGGEVANYHTPNSFNLPINKLPNLHESEGTPSKGVLPCPGEYVIRLSATTKHSYEIESFRNPGL